MNCTNKAAVEYASNGKFMLQREALLARDAFRAGVEWALSPPTPEEIEAAIQAHRGTHDHEMRTALLAFLEGRKR